MFEDFDFSGPGHSVGSKVEYSDGDFYVSSSGRLSVTPDSVASIASAVSHGPMTISSAHTSSGVRSLTASVNRSMGHGMGASLSYVKLF
jgi:hypothetical protein